MSHDVCDDCVVVTLVVVVVVGVVHGNATYRII